MDVRRTHGPGTHGPARPPAAPGAATVLAMLLAALVMTAACAAPAAEPAATPEGTAGEGLVIATTVAPITSLVATVAGDRARVTGIVPEGTNSHTFEPPPSVAALLADADVLYANGLQLEEPTRRLAEANLRPEADIIELGTQAVPAPERIFDFSFPPEGGKPNPHAWTNPRYALEYARIAAEDLASRDPGNAEYFMDNLTAFATLIDEFDRAARAAFATIPDGNKRLLTYHDSFPYFARDYDFDVVGAIQVADFGEPTAREVAALIDQVRELGVPAIFGSEVFPSPVLEQIGREADVAYVDDLRDDDLPGAPGDPEHSWLGLMRFDFITMTRALGGDPTPLEEFPLREVTADRAGYPQ